MGGERYSERKVGRAVPVTALRGVTGEPHTRHSTATPAYSATYTPLRDLPQSGADIPVCARPQRQTGMSAPQSHAPSLRQAGTATPCAGALSRELPCHPTPNAPRRPPSPPIGAGNRQHRHISAPVELKHHQSQIKNQKPTWRPWRLKRPSCLPAFLIQKTVAAPAPHMIHHAAPTFSHLRHAPKPAPSSAFPPRQKLL